MTAESFVGAVRCIAARRKSDIEQTLAPKFLQQVIFTDAFSSLPLPKPANPTYSGVQQYPA
ncbi:hypothetical protein HKX64_17400 [Sulfitobacter sp. M72]|nr:hypothetical protein [Sulfitobacter sp. M60]MDF3546105.1 hypothetical protein [Sulfitobacter sp. M72]